MQEQIIPYCFNAEVLEHIICIKGIRKAYHTHRILPKLHRNLTSLGCSQQNTNRRESSHKYHPKLQYNNNDE